MNYEYSNSITKTSEFSDIKTKSTELNEENQKIINSTDKSTNKSIELILEKELNYDCITCPYCDKNIYFQKNKEDRLNAMNIKCYHCSNYFYYSKCPKCKVYHKIPKIIHEGELISCLDEKDCKNHYFQTCCVVKNCPDIFNFTRAKNYTNLPTGVIYDHKKELIFQKISCYFCYRPIDFITKEENQINRYYEGQLIKCPYEDCKRKFNRIICPKCTSVIIVELGLYLMGSKIKCNSCNHIFGKVYCTHCSKPNPLDKSSFKYGEFECRFASCSKVSHIANCLHCQQMNYFILEKGQNLIHGQILKCGYKNCGKEFQSVTCPSCHNLNPFPNCDFIFGKLYKCKYKAVCSKSFMVLVCANCWTFSRAIEETEGKKYSCINCHTLLSNFGCPYCKKSILDVNSNYEKGQVMKCVYCLKKFSFCRCYDCKKLIYYKKDSSILGKAVKCECGVNSVNIICPLCNVRISISDRDNDAEIGEKIKCPNCTKEFEYKENIELNKEENVYFENLRCIKSLEGKKFDFGEGQVDANYLERQKIFPDSKIYNLGNNSSNISQNETDYSIKQSDLSRSEISLKTSLCIVCQCYEKESIFFPCGHRCVCYKCAVYYFEIFKKCPRCDKEASGIIPKVFES